MAKKKPLHFSVGKSLLLGSAVTMSMGAAGCFSNTTVNPGPVVNPGEWDVSEDVNNDDSGGPTVNPGPWDGGSEPDAVAEGVDSTDTGPEPEIVVNPGPWDGGFDEEPDANGDAEDTDAL